ncbi:hypothetical protein MJH12_03785 [bacterium]|nr:hypothetical protein [bacterium]
MKFNKYVEENPLCPLDGAERLSEDKIMYRYVHSLSPTAEDFLSGVELGRQPVTSTSDELCQLSGLSFFERRRSIKKACKGMSKRMRKSFEIYICKVKISAESVFLKRTPNSNSNSHYTVWPSNSTDLLSQIVEVEDKNYNVNEEVGE